MAVEDYFPDFMRDAYLLLIVFCFIAGTVGSSMPAESEFELAFSAYRLRQYDQNGVSYGSRNYKFSFEAVSLNQNALRRCLVVRWKDLEGKNLADFFSTSAGAVLVIVPKDLAIPTSRPKFGTLEEQFASLSTDLAIYFAVADEHTENLVDSIGTSHAPTAIQQIVNVFAENAFQISSSSSSATNALANPQFTNIIGRLTVADKNAPSIVIAAHYDSRSIIPGLSNGYDSNGSGVMALLSIMAKLSELYKANDMNPKLNMIFALTALGSYNYKGSRQLAEELAEPDGDRILLVICLESLLGGGEEDLYVHLSKTLQEKTAPFNFLRRMQQFGERRIVVKQDIDPEAFNWEHEPYFQSRISSLTISHFSTADHVSRNVLINDVDPKKEARDLKTFNWRVQVISETLISYIFGLNVECTEELKKADKCHVIQPFTAIQSDSALRELVVKPRPANELPSNLISDLHKLVRNYCHKSEKRTFTAPDLQLYGANVDQIVAQVVKPALFELVLASAIAAYTFVVYHFTSNAHRILQWQKTKIY